MPPWGADPHVGTWANDMSLTDQEIATIVAWAEQGAPEGDRAALPQAPTFKEGWQLGTPGLRDRARSGDGSRHSEDLFPEQWVELEEPAPTTVGARDRVPARRPPRDAPLPRHLQLGRQGRHRPRASSTPAQGAAAAASSRCGPPACSPTSSRRAWDVWSIPPPGFWSTATTTRWARTSSIKHQDRPLLRRRRARRRKSPRWPSSTPACAFRPRDPDYSLMGFHVFDNDSRILAMSPHMHVRGKAMRYELVYPDGKREAILDVPRYNYNYQWLYYPSEPVARARRIEARGDGDLGQLRRQPGEPGSQAPRSSTAATPSTRCSSASSRRYEDEGRLPESQAGDREADASDAHASRQRVVALGGHAAAGLLPAAAGQRLDLRRQRRQHDHHHARRHPLEGGRRRDPHHASRPPTPTGSRP